MTSIIALAVALLPGSGQAGTPKKKAPTSKKGRLSSSKRAGPPALALTATLHRPSDVSAETLKRDRPGAAKVKQVTKAARTEAQRWPAMKLEAVNTKETLSIRIYDRRGRTRRAALRRIWHLMRCHMTGQERPIHWRLVRNLYKVARHYPGRTLYIYSGNRARKVAALRSSNHIKGRAVDFRVSGISNRALRDYLMNNFKPCGVGFYPNAPFVHFDVREKQSAFWIDYSGKGQSSEYASDPYAVLKLEKSSGSKAKSGEVSNSAPKAAGVSAVPAAGADEPAEKAAPAVKARASEDANEETDESSRPSKPSKPKKAEAPAAPAEGEPAPP